MWMEEQTREFEPTYHATKSGSVNHQAMFLDSYNIFLVKDTH